LLEDTNLKDATSIAESILQNIREQKIAHEKSEISAYLTISIGLTLYQGQDTTAAEILKVADFALYESKKLGRDRLTYLSM